MGGLIPRQRVMSVHISDGPIPLLFLVLGFSAGAFLGLLFAVLGNGHTELYDYLWEYFSLIASGNTGSVSVLSTVWSLIRWPLLVALLGTVKAGVFALPLLMLIRGFLLSYAICIFRFLFGNNGLFLALAVFGVTVVFTIPVLFMIAHNGLHRILLCLYGKSAAPRLVAECLPVFLLSAGILSIAAIIQQSAMPTLLAMICSKVFTT